MKNSINKTQTTRKATSGFSLVETLMVVLVLTIVTGSIFQQIAKAQKNYRYESQKLDFTEQQRTFVDQFTRDLRQAGYPSPRSVGAGASAAQTVTITANSLTIEGDLDGTGVQVVTYDYNALTSSLERTASPKGGAANAPLTMVENVLPPGTNPPLFQSCDAAGNCPATGTIKSVSVSFTLQGTTQDTRVPIQTTMTATARLPNF
jgi:type II secretory pathway pseudopilin PulG